MIAKLIVWDADRELARRRMLRALSEFEVEGVHSLIPMHLAILEHPEFAAGGTMREFVEGGGYARSLRQEPPADGAAAVPEPPRNEARTLVTEVDGERFEVTVLEPEHPGRSPAARAAWRSSRSALRGGAAAADVIRSPMQGTVLKVATQAGGRGRRRARCWSWWRR